jgi:hypothetical protein
MTSEWEQEIRLLERETQISKWEDVLKFYKSRGIYEDIEKGNIIVLDEAVWVKINICGVQRFRKVKAISNFTVYYDSCYRNLYSSFQLGSLDHRFTIDGETLDLTHIENPRRRTMLLEFIKRNTEPPLPPVPKGILKL